MSDNSSSNSPREKCSRMSIFILTAQVVIYILSMFPLFILVLYLGYQRWRKQHSSSMAAKNSHSDIFTFNMVCLDLLGIFGNCLFCYGTYSNIQDIMAAGLYIFTIISPGQTLFYLLTCVDRYLAVVHPVTYLGLRRTSRVRTRNVIIGCGWVICILSPGSTKVQNIYMILNTLFLAFSFVIASFCSISVLCVLISPGPGEVGGNRDQSKQRAFHTIMAITIALFSRILSILIFNVLLLSPVIRLNDYCSAMSTTGWFTLPSSLVLPVLFLHKEGKLLGSK